MKLLDFEIGIDQPFFLISGPCVIESESLAMETAETLKKVTEELGINFIYKSSYDKANRSSTGSFRGLGIEEGLRILQNKGLISAEKMMNKNQVSSLIVTDSNSQLSGVIQIHNL